MGKKKDTAIARMLEYDREITRMVRNGKTDSDYYKHCVLARDRWIDKAKKIIKGQVQDG